MIGNEQQFIWMKPRLTWWHLQTQVIQTLQNIWKYCLINHIVVKNVPHIKFLSIQIDNKLKWNHTHELQTNTYPWYALTKCEVLPSISHLKIIIYHSIIITPPYIWYSFLGVAHETDQTIYITLHIRKSLEQ